MRDDVTFIFFFVSLSSLYVTFSSFTLHPLHYSIQAECKNRQRVFKKLLRLTKNHPVRNQNRLDQQLEQIKSSGRLNDTSYKAVHKCRIGTVDSIMRSLVLTN